MSPDLNREAGTCWSVGHVLLSEGQPRCEDPKLVRSLRTLFLNVTLARTEMSLTSPIRPVRKPDDERKVWRDRWVRGWKRGHACGFSAGHGKRFNYVRAAFGNGITGGLIYVDQVSKYEIWVAVGVSFSHFNL